MGLAPHAGLVGTFSTPYDEVPEVRPRRKGEAAGRRPEPKGGDDHGVPRSVLELVGDPRNWRVQLGQR